MDAHQKNVIANTGKFLDIFTKRKHIKWRMGLISTDTHDAPYLGFDPTDQFDNNSTDKIRRFQNSVKLMGLGGASDEKVFTPVLSALRAYPGFLREGSVFTMIAITDAAEQSGLDAKDFLDLLRRFAGSQHRIGFFGILNPTDQGCTETDGAWNYRGSPFEEVIKATQGQMHLLCDANFSRHLMDIGENMITRFEAKSLPFPDGVRPNPASIRVLFHGLELKGGVRERGGYWTYNYRANAVQFSTLDFAVGDHESVRIEYAPEL